MRTPNHAATLGRTARADESLLLTLLFLLLAAGTIVVALGTDAWWTTALALAGVAFSVAGALTSVSALLRSDDAAAGGGAGPSRAAALALGLAAVVAAVLAIVLPEHARAKPAAATAQTAQLTVRHFLTRAVVEDAPFAACQYLTPNAQREVARLAQAPTCRDAFTAATPAFDGIRSVGDVNSLPMRAGVSGDRATVVATPAHHPPATFVLARATPAELFAYQAPPDPWRIDNGEQVVLGAAATR